MNFDSAETAAQYVKATHFPSSGFTLAISDTFTFAGRADTMGAGMAVLIDSILAKGFLPDGFEQMVGYRIYRYKRME
jgi:hypothetical protein